ncbi:Uncharacterised protein [Mycobacteroides abscessus]|nr:Uncharacterised protein [Mycobacteroides abscessus]CPZ28222.1 Uncharacterised protein [Mycobacteroides abscessus]
MTTPGSTQTLTNQTGPLTPNSAKPNMKGYQYSLIIAADARSAAALCVLSRYIWRISH